MQTTSQSTLYKKAILTFLIVVILDQIIKVYIKLNFSLNETVAMIPHFIQLRFVENPGMAFGWELPGTWGKMALTLFRVVAVFAIGFYLKSLIKKSSPKGLIICVSLILAGAVGNIIDSVIYGVIFSESTMAKIAVAFPDQGYEILLRGNVVDMFEFTTRWPNWEWFKWRGQQIFPPIFNIADVAISSGVILILLKQKSFFINDEPQPIIEKPSVDADSEEQEEAFVENEME